MINIDIDLGQHTMQTPRGMRKLFLETIKALGIERGDFKVHLGINIKGGTQKGIKFIEPLSEYNAIVLRAQPNARDGRHICILYFPDIYKDQLSEFAEILQKEVGKENLSQDEMAAVEEDFRQETLLIKERQADELLTRQQEHEAKQTTCTREMMTLIIADIFEKHGTAWIIKKELFGLLNALKLDYPTNKLIGHLLGCGYLETDPQAPTGRSRLAPTACSLIGVVPEYEVRNREKFLKILEAFRETVCQCATISNGHADAVAELEKLKARDAWLRQRFERIVLIMQQKIAESESKIEEKKQEIELIMDRIAPNIVEVNSKFENMLSEIVG